MTKNFTLKEHLNKIRKIAHKTMINNGHYKKMGEASAKSRRKSKKLST